MSPLNDKEHFSQRYARQLILPEIGERGQEKLGQAKVAVIGAGGLGCPVVQYLVAAGVGEITIVDGDNVDLSNLQRQVVYSIHDLGHSKVEVLTQKMALLNPMVKLHSIKEFVQPANILPIIQNADIVIDCTDTFDSRYLINDACIISRKPFVSASVHGFAGQLAVFNYQGGPTYRCLFPEPPLPEDAPNCNEIGVLGIIPGILGTLQANEVLKMILGLGEVLAGQLLCVDATTLQFQKFAFHLNPANLQPRTLVSNAAECAPIDSALEIGNESVKINPLGTVQLTLPGHPTLAATLIDVREVWEFSQNPLPNAFNIPLTQLLTMDTNQVLEQLKLSSPETPLICVCYSGVRSQKAIKWLSEQGFRKTYSIKGGVKSWPSALRGSK